MAIRGKAQAEKELSEHFPSFINAVATANGHFWTTYAKDMHRTSGRSRANILCDWIGDELRKGLIGKTNIAFPDHYKTMSIAIGQNWYLRAHKLNEGGIVAVNDTQTCLAFVDNDLKDAVIPGFPDSATVIYLGYVENVSDPLSPRIILSCPDGAGEEPAWAIELGTAPPIPVGLPTEGEEHETRIVPKRLDREEAR
jgi:hypothetical protein